MKKISTVFKLRTILIIVGVLAVDLGAARIFLSNDFQIADKQDVLLFAAPACLTVEAGIAIFLANFRRNSAYGAGFLVGVLLTAFSTLVAIVRPQRIIIDDVLTSSIPRIDPGGLATQVWQWYLTNISGLLDHFAIEYDENYVMPIAATLPHLVAGLALGYLSRRVWQICRPGSGNHIVGGEAVATSGVN